MQVHQDMSTAGEISNLNNFFLILSISVTNDADGDTVMSPEFYDLSLFYYLCCKLNIA